MECRVRHGADPRTDGTPLGPPSDHQELRGPRLREQHLPRAAQFDVLLDPDVRVLLPPGASASRSAFSSYGTSPPASSASRIEAGLYA